MTSDPFKPDIDLYIIFKEFRKDLIKILLVISLISLTLVAYSLSITNQYTSKITLIIDTEKPQLSTAAQGFASSLAFLPKTQNIIDADTEQIFRKLKSREFILHLKENEPSFLPLLLGVSSYDPDNKLTTFDENLVDTSNLSWRDGNDSITFYQLSKTYNATIQAIHISNANLVELSATSISPEAAFLLVKMVKDNYNEISKQEDLYEATRSIEYLQIKLSESLQSDVKQAIGNLIENQLSTVLLANVREEYVLKTFDEAYLPEFKSIPNRPVIVVVGTIIGILLTFIFFLLIYYKNRLIRK